MAKKTITPPKTAPKAEAPAPPAAPKPRARVAAPKKKADNVVVAEDLESTILSAEPSDEAIRIRAYHRYLERGGGHGMDFEDWLEAKRELRELTDQK
jgi:hypothetical protein